MTAFKIPGDIQHATDSLNSIGMLITASEWQRSAIVRAFVTKGNGRPRKTEEKSSVSIDGFVRLGVVGLTTKDTVRRYYDAWELTGLPDPVPGESIAIPGPELEFPRVKNDPAPQPVSNPGQPKSSSAHQPFRGSGDYNNSQPEPDPVPPHDRQKEDAEWKLHNGKASPLDNYTPEDAIKDWKSTLERIYRDMASMAKDKEILRRELHAMVDRSIDESRS